MESSKVIFKLKQKSNFFLNKKRNCVLATSVKTFIYPEEFQNRTHFLKLV